MTVTALPAQRQHFESGRMLAQSWKTPVLKHFTNVVWPLSEEDSNSVITLSHSCFDLLNNFCSIPTGVAVKADDKQVLIRNKEL